eukprot:7031085-Prymnesium_polylepis.1
MNGDGGDGGGVGNVAVRYRGASTARPMVGGWERRERCCVCGDGGAGGAWLCSSAVAVGGADVAGGTLGSLIRATNTDPGSSLHVLWPRLWGRAGEGGKGWWCGPA